MVVSQKLARFADARNTAEGKLVSVLLSLLLVFSFLNVTMFTDRANAEEDAEVELMLKEVNDQPAPETEEPEVEAQVGEPTPEEEPEPTNPEPNQDPEDPEGDTPAAAADTEDEGDPEDKGASTPDDEEEDAEASFPKSEKKTSAEPRKARAMENTEPSVSARSQEESYDSELIKNMMLDQIKSEYPTNYEIRVIDVPDGSKTVNLDGGPNGQNEHYFYANNDNITIELNKGSAIYRNCNQVLITVNAAIMYSETVVLHRIAKTSEYEIIILKLIPNTETTKYYEVKYTDGVDGEEVFADQVWESVRENEPTPGFKGVPEREGYTFKGWSPSPALKVTGNAIYTAQWEANAVVVNYSVKHMQEKVDSSDYELTEEEIKSGTVGAYTEASAKNYEGFTAQELKQATIDASGNTTVDIHYKRNVYKVEYRFEEGNKPSTVVAPCPKSYKFGETVTVEDDLNAQGWRFDGWTSTDVKPTDNRFEMPAKPVVFVGNWKPCDDTKYKVEFYYQNDDGSWPTETVLRSERVAPTDSEVTVSETDKKPDADHPGYVFNEGNINILEGRVAGDGSTVLKVYFKKQFTVIFTSGNKPELFEDAVHSDVDYNGVTPAAPATQACPDPDETGWLLAGW